MDESKALTADEFRRHWKLVLATSVGFAFASVTSTSTGLFMQPLGDEFGWSRTLQSSGMSITAALTFFLSPLFGLLIDRWGTRRMALTGLALAALMISSFSLANGSAWQWIGLWTVYAFAAVMIKSTVWTAAVSSVFEHGRGLALGLTLSGTAVATAIVPPITNALIDAYGWRGAFVGLGLGGGAIALVVCYFFMFDAYDAAKARRAETAVTSEQLLDVPGLSVSEAWRSSVFWQIGAATFVMMVITIGLNIHQFPILTAAGVDRTSAAWYSGIAGIAGIAGKLITGWLLDRYHARWIGGVTLASTAVAFAILMMPGLTPAMIVFAMVINGYAAGTKLQIASFLTSAYGGMRNFGGIFGVVASLIAAGSGLGPVLGGFIFDTYGSYDPFLIVGIAGSLLSGLLIFALGPYPDWKEAEV